MATVTFGGSDGNVTVENAQLPWTSPPQGLSLNDEAHVSASLAGSDQRGVRCQVQIDGEFAYEELSITSCRVQDTVERLLNPEPYRD